MSMKWLTATKRFTTRTLLLCALAVCAALGPAAVLAGERVLAMFGEVRPDQALVYFIRSPEFGGWGTLHVFADEAFLGVLEDRSYSFAYVDPGTHLFWVPMAGTVGPTREIEVLAGETYYLMIRTEIALLEEAMGQAQLRQIGDYVTPTDRERKKTRDFVESRLAKAREREADKGKAVVAPPAAPQKPVDTTGLLKVPARTIIPLELMENISSVLKSTGDSVLFTVADDVSVEGQVVLMKGTPVRGTIVHIRKGKAAGRQGAIDITIPEVGAEDGTVVPLVAQIAAVGEDKTHKATSTAVLVGVWGFLVRGGEAYRLAGERVMATTRQDVWVSPAKASRAATVAGSPPTDLEINGWVHEEIDFDPSKRGEPDDVKVMLDAPSPPDEVRITTLGGWTLPEPLRPGSVEQEKLGWACTFGGKDVVRFLRAGSGKETILTVAGHLADGSAFTSAVRVRTTIETY